MSVDLTDEERWTLQSALESPYEWGASELEAEVCRALIKKFGLEEPVPYPEEWAQPRSAEEYNAFLQARRSGEDVAAAENETSEETT